MALGSISLPQRPIEGAAKIPAITNWTPILPYTAKQTSISGLFYFKFVLDIQLDDSSGTLIGKLVQRHNGDTDTVTNVYAIFDIREIVNSVLSNTELDQNDTTKSIHTLGKNDTDKIFSTNSNQLRSIYVNAYQSYSTSASVVPTQDTDENADNTKVYTKASLPLETPRTSGEYFQGTQFQTYQTKSDTSLFLSDLQPSFCVETGSNIRRTYVQEADFHTLGFLNGKDTFDSDLDKMQISFYNSDGSSNGSATTIINGTATGGKDPSSGGTLDNSEKLLYFGCGPANLEAYDDGGSNVQRPSNHSNWAWYKVKGWNTAVTSKKSVSYYFIKQDSSCKGFKTRRLAWINSKGCYDYFNFSMKSTQTINVERNSYGKLIGDFSGTEYSYNNIDGSRRVQKVIATRTETLNTDSITEEDAELLENLIMSTDVYVVEGTDTTYTVPVMIKDSSFVRKTSANDKAKIQYTIKIEYSNPVNSNS